MSLNRKPIFDAVRKLLGRGLRQSEVAIMDGAIDAAEGAIVVRPPLVTDDVPDEAVELVTEFEGTHKVLSDGRIQAYPDPASGGDPWTIGIGTTVYPDGTKVRRGDIITLDEAKEYLRHDLKDAARQLAKMLGKAPASRNQRAALISWIYNVGAAAAAKSTLIKKHKAGDFAGAADELLRWVKAAGKTMPGLVRRRKAERALYLAGRP